MITSRKWAGISIRRPKLKIPTKELPLIAIGITAVLISGLLRQPLIRYVLMAIFFGILSKETRWTYWGMFVLIDAFSAFRFLLNTDRDTIMFDTAYRLSMGAAERIALSGNISSTYIAPATDALASLGNNPFFSMPVVIVILSIVMAVIGAVYWIFSIVLLIISFTVMLPVIGHLVSMLYIFHRNDIASMLRYTLISGAMPADLGRLVAPYLIQGMAIQMVMMSAIFPLIFYKILKRIGFYRRIPSIQS